MAGVPSEPQIHIRPRVSVSTIQFNWLAPVSDGGSAITGYTIESADDPSSPYTVGPTATTYIVTDLSNNFQYTYTIAATNGNGTGAIATFRAVKPGPRPNPVASASATAIDSTNALVSWTPAASGSGPVATWTVPLPTISAVNLTNVAVSSNTIAVADNTNIIRTSIDYGFSWNVQAGFTSDTFSSRLVFDPFVLSGTIIYVISTGASGSTFWTGTGLPYIWTSSLISSTNASFSLIAASAGNYFTIYVADYTNNILKSIDAGATWTPLSFPGNNISDIATDLSGTNIFVTAQAGSPQYISNDGGSTWNETTISGICYQVRCSSDFTKIVVSQGNNTVLISTNSGDTWAETSAVNSVASISNIILSSDGSKLIVSDNTGGYLYISTDDGTIWTTITGAGARPWSSIASPDGIDIVAICGIGGLSTIQTSRDSGNTWLGRSAVGSLTATVCSSNGIKAAGLSAYVWTSSNSGYSWEEYAGLGKPASGGTFNNAAVGLAASSDLSFLYAAGVNDYIYVSTDLGVSWTSLLNSGERAWTAITCSSDGTVIAAVVSGGNIWISYNSGSSWTSQTEAGVNTWNAIASSSDGTKLIIGTEDDYMYIGIYSGSSWTWTPQTGPGQSYWTSVSSSADGSVLAGADYENLWLSNNSGTSWATVMTPNSWAGVSISANGMTIAAITSGGMGGAGEVWLSINSGTTWNQESLSNASNLNSVTLSADGYTIYVGGYSNVYIKSLWTVPTNPIYPQEFATIACSADGMKLITGNDNFGYISTSADGGATWTEQIYSGGRVWQSISSSADGTVLFALVYNGYIYNSSDSGVSWQKLAPGQKLWYNISTTANGEKVAAVNSDPNEYIYISVDAGVTWTQSSSISQWYSVAYSSDGSTLIAAEVSGYIWISTDDGTSWTQQTPEINSWPVVISSSDGTTLYAGAEGDYIYKGVKSGASWNWSPLTNSPQLSWGSIACSGNGSIIVAAGTSRGYLYISTDSGSSWTNYLEPGVRRWKGVSCSSNGTKIAAVAPYAIYTTPDTGTTWLSRTGILRLSWYSIVSTEDGTQVAAIGVDPSEEDTYIYVSKDSGVTFAQLSLGNNTGPGSGSNLVSFYGTNIIAFTSDYIYKSLDSGISWSLLTSPAAGTIGCVASSLDQAKLFAGIINDYIYASTDGGSTWNPLLQSSQVEWTSITCSADGTKLVAVSADGTVWASTNSGASWAQTTLSLSNSILSISSSADGSVVVFGDGIGVGGTEGYVWISRDYGVSWTSITTLGLRLWSGVSISADGMKIVAADGNSGGYIYISTDSGVTWNQDLPSDLYGPWSYITISSDGSKLFAGTLSTRISQFYYVFGGGAFHIKSLGGAAILPIEIDWYVVRIKRDDAVGPKYLPKVNTYPYYTSITIPDLDLTNHSYNFFVYGVNDPGFSPGVETNSIP